MNGFARYSAGLVFLVALPCQGAPVISGASGDAAHASLLTINGSGFGAHANYNNIGDTWRGHRYLNFRWTDFDISTFTSNASASDGFYPQKGGAYWSNWSTNGLSIQNGGPSVSGKFIKRQLVSGESGGLSADMPDAADSYSHMYVSAKFMMSAPGGRQQSGKFLRIYGDAGNVYFSSGGSDLALRGAGEFGCGSTAWGGSGSFGLDKWSRVDVHVNTVTQEVSSWIDGKLQWTNKWWCKTGGFGGHTVDIPNMLDDSSRGYGQDGSYNFTDIFLNFTPARVELTNASTYSASTQKEVQIPVAWGANSITVALNRGGFAQGAKVYLYVIDENGNPNSQGFPVTIGGSLSVDGQSALPSPPANFSVQ